MRNRWVDLFALCDAQAREVEAMPDKCGAARHRGTCSRRGRVRAAVPRCAESVDLRAGVQALARRADDCTRGFPARVAVRSVGTAGGWDR